VDSFTLNKQAEGLRAEVLKGERGIKRRRGEAREDKFTKYHQCHLILATDNCINDFSMYVN
jgi:hypothetical protein